MNKKSYILFIFLLINNLPSPFKNPKLRAYLA